MKGIQQPKKQPDLVRKLILEQAIMLASQKGISGVSIQNVANGAGISKGGVFHHFANKQILVEQMIHEIITLLDRTIEGLMQNDPTEYGKFTRAYIQSAFSLIDGLVSPWTALSMTMITETTFNTLWEQWLNQRLAQHEDTDGHRDLAFVRLATDGLWLKNITGVIDEPTFLQLKNELLDRSY